MKNLFFSLFLFISFYISLIMVSHTMYKNIDPFSVLILNFSWLGVQYKQALGDLILKIFLSSFSRCFVIEYLYAYENRVLYKCCYLFECSYEHVMMMKFGGCKIVVYVCSCIYLQQLNRWLYRIEIHEIRYFSAREKGIQKQNSLRKQKREGKRKWEIERKIRS